MGAPVLDFSRPNSANVYNTDLDAIRNNIVWIMTAVAANGYRIPGWSSIADGVDLTKPDSVTLTNNGNPNIRMRFGFSWGGTGGTTLTAEVWQFDSDGGGFDILPEGTITHTYSGSNWWKAVSA